MNVGDIPRVWPVVSAAPTRTSLIHAAAPDARTRVPRERGRLQAWPPSEASPLPSAAQPSSFETEKSAFASRRRPPVEASPGDRMGARIQGGGRPLASPRRPGPCRVLAQAVQEHLP